MDNAATRWHREATARGLDFIVLVYDKAEGFVFCPTNPDYPFGIGGDYNGCMHTTAAGAQQHVDHGLKPAYRDRIEWFIPYLRAVVRGEDFSLDDLQLETRKVRLIHGKWPW